MLALIVVLASVTAVAAAARSTWSPCGRSMMSTITPFREQSRGHRYGVTAAWFLLGATAGGATLGGLAAALAAAAKGLGFSGGRAPTLVLGAIAALATVVVDTGAIGDWLPIWRRQVNDQWLATYRSWVYGAGFGWQIGVGIATYIMTAGIFLMVVLAAVTADPLIAFAVCAGFGAARGTAVLLTWSCATPSDLHRLHRKLAAVEPGVRQAVIAIEIAVAGLALGWLDPAAGVAIAAAGIGCEVAAVRRRNRSAKQGSPGNAMA